MELRVMGLGSPPLFTGPGCSSLWPRGETWTVRHRGGKVEPGPPSYELLGREGGAGWRRRVFRCLGAGRAACLLLQLPPRAARRRPGGPQPLRAPVPRDVQANG